MEATEEVELREGPLEKGGMAAGGARGVDTLERGAEGAVAVDAAPLCVEGGGCRGNYDGVLPAELLVLLHESSSCIFAFSILHFLFSFASKMEQTSNSGIFFIF